MRKVTGCTFLTDACACVYACSFKFGIFVCVTLCRNGVPRMGNGLKVVQTLGNAKRKRKYCKQVAGSGQVPWNGTGWMQKLVH